MEEAGIELTGRTHQTCWQMRLRTRQEFSTIPRSQESKINCAATYEKGIEGHLGDSVC